MNMAALDASERKPSMVDRIIGMFNIFLDPAGAAKNIRLSWSWVAPLVLSSIVIGICGYLLIPTTLRIMQMNPPPNMTAEQFEKARPIIEMSQKVSALASPVIIGVFTALFAGILTAACAVLDIRSRFRDHFSLLAHTGLIGALGYLCGFLVIRLRGDAVQSLLELRPGFGLDLFLGEHANKFVYGLLNFFSLFQLWNIVMLGLTFAFLTNVSKGRAFAATAPVWLLGLVLALVGVMFQR
ncbi:MAG TPA: YIP1 family protein [Bryobacteraceae bacterium]|nr:YIP1 family protein [Bryobacteraceae bacterium]